MKRVLAPLLLALLPLAAGCRIDMHDQPKYEPYEPSTLFVSGTSALAPPEGTVARGTLGESEVLSGFTEADELVTSIPIPVDLAVVRRGQSLYNAVCAPCHDMVGSGRGMVVRRGYLQPPSFHIDRLRESPPGYYYDVITRGFGQMPAYASQIAVEDRWAIVAYIQALHLSQGADLAELTDDDRMAAEAAGHPGGIAHHGGRVPGAAGRGTGADAGEPSEDVGMPTGAPEPGSGGVGEVPEAAVDGPGSGESR